MVIGYPESGIQLFRDYYSASAGREEILVPDGLRDGSMPGRVGNEMSNVTGTAPAAGGPNQDAFASMFEEAYGSAPGVFTSQSYDSVALLLLANAAAGVNDGTKLRDQMRRVATSGGTEVGPQNFLEGSRWRPTARTSTIGASPPKRRATPQIALRAGRAAR